MKVFTWEQIRDNKIPKKESFGFFLQSLQDKLRSTEGVLAASHFGSTQRGDYSMTSDIDIYVVYEPDHGFELKNSLQELYLEAKGYYIPLKVITVPKDEILFSEHSPISPRLQQVLAYTAHKDDGCFVGDMKEFLFHYNTMSSECFMGSVRIDIERYIGYKLRKFYEGKLVNDLFSERKRAEWMESVANGFVHITRGMLASYGRFEFIDGSISEVWDVLHKNKSESGAPDLFSQYLGARVAYLNAIDNALDGPPKGICLKEVLFEMGSEEWANQYKGRDDLFDTPQPHIDAEANYKQGFDLFAHHLCTFPEYVKILQGFLK